MIGLILLIISVLAASALCSLVEAAILSMPLLKTRILFEKGIKGSKDLLAIKQNIHGAIATIVVINNFINIIGAVFIARLATEIFGNQWLGVASAFITFLIIVIGEIIPKTIGEHYKITVSLMSAKLLRGVIFIMRPLVAIVVLASNYFKKQTTVAKVTEDEIKMMLKLGMKEGTVEVDEEILCGRVFKLNDLKAVHMMKPIDRVYSLEAEQKLNEAKDKIIDALYSRIVVYDKNLSNIIGVVQQRKLLKELSKDNYNSAVKEFMTRPIFVNENESADKLLEKFQAYHQHLFIVQNDKNENIGVISMEDVLEELFGEIYDEKDLITKPKP